MQADEHHRCDGTDLEACSRGSAPSLRCADKGLGGSGRHCFYLALRATAGGERVRHGEAERLSRLQIDEVVIGRKLNRQIGRLLALEDTIDVAGGASPLRLIELRRRSPERDPQYQQARATEGLQLVGGLPSISRHDSLETSVRFCRKIHRHI
jgi:hypothetical protein